MLSKIIGWICGGSPGRMEAVDAGQGCVYSPEFLSRFSS